jgi:phosphatidylethanolamine/phosphatidyl-N-methylethanolamine N-methyltransferase
MGMMGARPEARKSEPRPDLATATRTEDVLGAYARWAPVYDVVFGPVMHAPRRAAVAAIPPDASRVLEVGVGTGISLPHYPPTVRITGIDLSPDMLERARARVSDAGLRNVEALVAMDASELSFPADRFDVAMAMFVMTVVPDPARVMAEMRRVVRPGGLILAVSHFASERGVRKLMGRPLSPLGRRLGWNTTITISALAALPGVRMVSDEPAGLGGFYRLLRFMPEK